MNRTLALFATGLALCAGTNASAQTYTNAGNDVAIPDNNATGAFIEIFVPDYAAITDLNVGVIITHSYQGDIIATIEHVDSATSATIINRPCQPATTFGYSADNYGNVGSGAFFGLDDGAAVVYDRPPLGGGPNDGVGIANVTGSWIPDSGPNDSPEGVGSLAVFNGKNIHGTWRLRVSDNAAIDTGAIRALQLVFLADAGCGVPGNGSCYEPHGGLGCNNSDCCAEVCAADPFCCDVEWDGICVDEAANLCNSCGNPNSGSCGAADGTPFCSDEACCTAVCAIDPFCCSTSWDSICVDEALQLCVICGGASAGSCFEPHKSPYCNDGTCCNTVCAFDSFCCEIEWDAICVAEASALCDVVPPINDTCAQGIALDNQPVGFSTVGANTEGPQHPGCLPNGIGADVWFTYNATSNGIITIHTCGDFLMGIAVYENCTCPLLGEPLACSSFSLGTCDGGGYSFQTSFQVFNGQCLKIRIGGQSAGNELYHVGNAVLTISKDFCVGDLDDDNDVDIDDLLVIINTWGFIAAPGFNDGDISPPGGDGLINIDDLLVIINGWGNCPSQCPVGFTCPGGVAGDGPPCRQGGDPNCVCFTSIRGNRVCANHGVCLPCQGNGTCPPGYVCVIDTCCGAPTCLPICGSGPPLPSLQPGTRTSAGVVGPDGTILTETGVDGH